MMPRSIRVEIRVNSAGSWESRGLVPAPTGIKCSEERTASTSSVTEVGAREEWRVVMPCPTFLGAWTYRPQSLNAGGTPAVPGKCFQSSFSSSVQNVHVSCSCHLVGCHLVTCYLSLAPWSLAHALVTCSCSLAPLSLVPCPLPLAPLSLAPWPLPRALIT